MDLYACGMGSFCGHHARIELVCPAPLALVTVENCDLLGRSLLPDAWQVMEKSELGFVPRYVELGVAINHKLIP